VSSVSTNSAVPALELQGLSKSFGGLHAVRGVTFKIMPGDRKAIIGPNGAGKTTLFNLITGIFPSSSGKVLLFGQDVTRWQSHRRTALGMARTFQVTSLFPRLTVLDNVLLAIKGLRQSKYVMWRFLSSYRDVYDKAHQLLEQAAFLDRANTEVRYLSHGEQRQLEIVLGLASDPKILLLDEPAADQVPDAARSEPRDPADRARHGRGVRCRLADLGAALRRGSRDWCAGADQEEPEGSGNLSGYRLTAINTTRA
jgi:branched-chain amino acid transport system ATP-binding protein